MIVLAGFRLISTQSFALEYILKRRFNVTVIKIFVQLPVQCWRMFPGGMETFPYMASALYHVRVKPVGGKRRHASAF